jgi:ABC-2 type transport system ATP-binding protein
VSAAEPVLEARGLTRRFGPHVALAPVDFALHAGEAVALAGPNGAGKSTLLALLAGALSPSAGVVRRRPGVGVGWVPQQPAHYGRLSARENLELFARLRGEAEPRAAARRLLDSFELLDDGRPSGALSVGNRQRLNVAIALLGRPQVLLLDEPTASLDPDQRARLWELETDVRGSGGAVVFATQNLEELERVADRALVLRGGEVAYAGSPAGALEALT